MALAREILVMNGGRVEDFGTPRRLYEAPASRFTAEFIGESTLVDGIVERDDSGIWLDTPLARVPADGLTPDIERAAISIRPEHLELDGESGVPTNGTRIPLGRARVVDAAFQGSFLRVRAQSLDMEGLQLLLKLPPETDLGIDDEIRVRASLARISLIPATTVPAPE